MLDEKNRLGFLHPICSLLLRDVFVSENVNGLVLNVCAGAKVVPFVLAIVEVGASCSGLAAWRPPTGCVFRMH